MLFIAHASPPAVYSSVLFDEQPFPTSSRTPQKPSQKAEDLPVAYLVYKPTEVSQETPIQEPKPKQPMPSRLQSPLSDLPSALLSALSPTVAALRQAADENRSRREPLVFAVYTPDFRSFILPSGGHDLQQSDGIGVGVGAVQALPTSTFWVSLPFFGAGLRPSEQLALAPEDGPRSPRGGGPLHVKKRTMPFDKKKILPHAAVASGGPGIESITAVVTAPPSTSKTASSSLAQTPQQQQQQIDGSAIAYLHTDPDSLRLSFVSLSSPFFILGAGREGQAEGRSTKVSASASTPPASPGPLLLPSSSSSSYRYDPFAPLLLSRQADGSLLVLRYRRIRGEAGGDDGIVAELLSRVVVVQEGGVVVVCFEAVEEAALDNKAAKMLAERREQVEKDFKIAAAKEFGILVLVRTQ